MIIIKLSASRCRQKIVHSLDSTNLQHVYLKVRKYCYSLSDVYSPILVPINNGMGINTRSANAQNMWSGKGFTGYQLWGESCNHILRLFFNFL